MTFKFKANIFQIDQTYWNLILMLLDTFAHEKKIYTTFIFLHNVVGYRRC